MVLLILLHRMFLPIMNAFEFVVRNCNDANNRNTITIDDDADADDVNDFDIVDPVDVDADDVTNLLHFILTMPKLFR